MAARGIGSFGGIIGGGRTTTVRQGPGVIAGGIEDLPLPAPGLVRLRAVAHPGLGLVAELNGPVLPKGYGSHTVTPRKARLSITTFEGLAPLELPLPLLLDRWSEQGSVEAEITVLETLLGRRGGRDISRPPQIIIEGFGIPHSYSRDASLRFTLTGDPAWGEDIRTRGTDGHRSYVPVTVTALQVNLPDIVQDAAGNVSRAYYTVPKTGSPRTLRGIARKYHVSDWRRVRALNRAAPGVPGDPDKAIKAGTRVRYA
jgi:hypothetical protein